MSIGVDVDAIDVENMLMNPVQYDVDNYDQTGVLAEPISFGELSASAKYYAERLQGCPFPSFPVETAEEKRKFTAEILTMMERPNAASKSGERQRPSFANWTIAWNRTGGTAPGIRKKTEKQLEDYYKASLAKINTKETMSGAESYAAA